MQYRHRVLVTGPSEGGKSTLARRLFLSAAAPRLVIDPSDSELCDVPGSVTFRDPTKFDPNVETARFVPLDPGDMDAYDELYRRVKLLGGPRYIWVDEGGIVLPANGTTKWQRAVVVQGRKAELGHLVLHTRLREIYRQLFSVLFHLIIVSGLPNKDDRRDAADIIGISLDQLESLLADLPPFGILWWQREAKQIVMCPPLEV